MTDVTDDSIGVVDEEAAGASNTQPVRTLTATLWENGATKIVHMQVMSLADESGNLIALGPMSDRLDDLVREARIQTAVLALLVGTVIDRDLSRNDLEQLASG